jgi:sugar/nucleoside kinase (ribokinase family)
MAQGAVDRAAIVVVGNLNDDLMLLDVPGLPAWGQELLVERHSVATAGQAGYLAMALGALGRSVSCVSAVGDDQRGRAIVAELERFGIDATHVTSVPDTPTGLTVALVRPDGERAFVSDLGASRTLAADTVANAVAALPAPGMLAMVGLFNTPALGIDDAAEVMRLAHSRGALTMFDPGWDPAGWPADTRNAVLAALEHVDVFLPNADEAYALTGHADPQLALQSLSSAGAATVVIKCGPDGSLGLDTNGVVHHQPALAVDGPVNAVGAGDTYDACFIHAFLNKAPLTLAMSAATAAASLYVTRTTDRFPHPDQIRRLLPADTHEIL